jgi:RNA polymerase sigma-70 factor (ECF subfamily)
MGVEATPATPMSHDIEPGPHRRRPSAPEEPFDRLFLAEYGKVVAVANRVLADRAEAEDVAQEVFLDFHRKQHPNASYASGWLYRAAVHTALNRIRSRRRRQRRELADVGGQEPSVVDPQQLVEVEEERRRVRDALARLPVKSASVLALRYSGLSYVEVGTALGVGAGQVGTLLRRAEQALRKEMTRATPE